MSNRPNRKPSRSADLRPPAGRSGSSSTSSASTTGSADGPPWGRIAAIGGVVAVIAVGVLTLVLTRADGGSGSAAPTTSTLPGLAGKGQVLASSNGCDSCHSANGSKMEGPTWKGLAGSKVTLTDGSTVTADDAYLTSSIKEPNKQLVQGYKTNAMPPRPLSDDDVAALVAYIKALP